MKVYIIGAGPGDSAYLTDEAKSAITTSDITLSTKRLYDSLLPLSKNMLCMELGEFAPFILENKGNYEKIAVLASGDIGFFSVAKSLSRALPDFEIILVSGISSLQYLTAKCGYSYENIKIVSVHGRERSVIPAVCYNPLVFVLTGGKYKAHDVISNLCKVGLGSVQVCVGENLSHGNEKILHGSASNLKDEIFSDLAVLIIENKDYVNPYAQIHDDDFVRGKTPMTKQSVRTLSVAALEVEPNHTVLDIGAGTGSVSIVLARAAYEGNIISLERNAEALSLIEINRKKFGAFNIEIISAHAPGGLLELPKIDRAFIGGSGGNLSEILAILKENNPQIRVVINAVTLETLSEASSVLKTLGFDIDMACINSSHSQALGSYHFMKSENPVYIITGK